MYSAKILADSIAHGVRLTTLEVVFPRFVLAEFNTHRVFSRNSASSRAIPVKRRIEQVLTGPFIPEAFERNQRGMVGGDVIDEDAVAKIAWTDGLKPMIALAQTLDGLKAHKHWANRPIEIWAWHTVIVSSTEWENYDNLRDHAAASPEMRHITRLMKRARAESTPRELKRGEWHLPMVRGGETVGDWVTEDGDRFVRMRAASALELVKISVARCARVSYETHDTGKIDIEGDLVKHDEHLTNGHMSPFEHQARLGPRANPHSHVWPHPEDVKINSDEDTCLRCNVPRTKWESHCKPVFIGNFRTPWIQYRKMLPGEDVFRG